MRYIRHIILNVQNQKTAQNRIQTQTVTVCGTEKMDVGNDCLIVEQSNIIYLLAKREDTGKRSNNPNLVLEVL